MNARTARSKAMVRLLSAIGPVKRRGGRLPRQQQPDAIRLEYAKALEELVCARLRDFFEPVGREIIASLTRLRQRQEQTDSADTAPELRALEPAVEAVARAAGSDRPSPAILARPDLGAWVGDVQGVLAAYDPDPDVIHVGAVTLRLLARPLALGVVSSDEDLVSCKVVAHEALHAAARGRCGPASLRDTEGAALMAIEEATAEIAAQLLTPVAAEAIAELSPWAAERAAAPLFRWSEGDLRLTRAASYVTWTLRIARLAALARVPLREWVLGIRQQRGVDRIAEIARWLAVEPGAVVAYLGRPRGERDSIASAARDLGMGAAPVDAPAWAATGDPVPGELEPAAIDLLREAEAAITAPAITAQEALDWIARVDALADPRASFHARTALQQRVLLYGDLVGASSKPLGSLQERAALVLAFDPEGRLLLGRRRGSKRWALPGGHVERGESPRRAAARELDEEANLTTAALDLVHHFTNRAGVRIWVYRCIVRGEPTGYYDPDREFAAWRFVDVSAGLPDDVRAELDVPGPPDNLLLQLFPSRDHLDAAPRRPRRRRAPPPPREPERDPEEELRRARARAGAAGRDLGRAQREGERAGRMIDRAAARFADAFRPRELEAVARRFGERTSDFQRQQLDRQIRAAMGVSFTALERPIQDGVEEWVAQNVDLVRSISDRYFDRLRLDVQDAYAGGTHPETLAKDFADRYDMSLNDARRLARDQVGKLNADVNHERQRALGVERATWRSMKDNRVCDECDEKDGETFDLSTGLDGVLPGYCHPMDRCYAEPDLSALIDG